MIQYNSVTWWMIMYFDVNFYSLLLKFLINEKRLYNNKYYRGDTSSPQPWLEQGSETEMNLGIKYENENPSRCCHS